MAYVAYNRAMEINATYVASTRHLASACRRSLEDIRQQKEADIVGEQAHFHQLAVWLAEAGRHPWDRDGAGSFSRRLSNHELVERSAESHDLTGFLAEACRVLEHLSGGRWSDLDAGEQRFATHRLEPFLLRMTVIGR